MAILRSFGSKKSDLQGSRSSRKRFVTGSFELKTFPSDSPCIGFGLSAKHLKTVSRYYVKRFSKETIRLAAGSPSGLAVKGFFLRSRGKMNDRRDFLRKELEEVFGHFLARD